MSQYFQVGFFSVKRYLSGQLKRVSYQFSLPAGSYFRLLHIKFTATITKRLYQVCGP